jgi:hypothetical protein
MSANSVPPPAGFVLSSEASYTALIPRYPVRSRKKERVRESRGPLESASFPTNGADPYTPTAEDFDELIDCAHDQGFKPYDFRSDRPSSVACVTTVGEIRVADHKLDGLHCPCSCIKFCVNETHRNKPRRFERFQCARISLACDMGLHT